VTTATSLSSIAAQLPDGPPLADVLDESLLAEMVQIGYVRVQVHPDLPYVIHNYTEKAAYESVWNAATLTCRGLIVDARTNRIVARPFPKFFNYGQLGAPVLDLDTEAIVTDKADGSLGILYPTPTGHAIATRGSFTSEQAEHATAVWLERYASRFVPAPGVTYLFEIVYPANRIVLDYGDLDDLILLGAIDIVTGADAAPAATEAWPGQRVAQFPYATLADALVAPPRENAEGLVVYLRQARQRLKLKQADYVALHRIVTGLNARTVWQHLVDGRILGELIEPLPDEFHGWVRDIANGIADWIVTEHGRLETEYDTIIGAMPADWQRGDRAGRKDFALVASAHPDKWAMFNFLDAQDIRPELLKRAKPEAFITPSGRTYGEDTA
jgi:RNA ligase